MSKYIPTPAYHDQMPVDISFVFKNERPAGKHGFSKVDGDNFRFEDGTPGKFWGVNAEGYYVGKLATTYEDGWLKFHVGDHFPASHYLIMAE